VQYLGANVPQAWAAGAVFAFTQAILGFQPDAPHGVLYVDPSLPDWLAELTIRDLRVGSQCFDLKLWREGDLSRWEVLAGPQDAVRYRSVATGCGL
jgi:hypothetical protein